MNELQRLAYLQAMGTDSYISLRQLPGAAVTRRLAIVRNMPPLHGMPGERAAQERSLALPSAPGPRRARILSPASPPAASDVPSPTMSTGADQAPRFSLAAISVGGWLWLEELEQSPVSPEQIQLLQAIAAALGLPSRGAGDSGQAAGIEITQFDWPIHTNRQLDLGREAARSGAAGFIRRKLEQLDCRGLVLLGQACEACVALDQLECPRLVRTLSTAAMLREPLLKKQAWLDLRPFFQQS